MNNPSSLSEEVSRPGVLDLRSLYREHAVFLRRFLLRLGVRHADVDDVLQDVFVVALRRRATFNGSSTVKTWLGGIAYRLAVAHCRRRRFRAMLGLGHADSEELVSESSSGDPRRSIERAEARRQLQEIIGKLAPLKRAVFVLYEVDQLSGEEIAALVGCPLKTVWSRLFYARRDFAAAVLQLQLLEDREVASGKRRVIP